MQALALTLATPALAQSNAAPTPTPTAVSDGGGNGGYAITTSTALSGARVVSSGSQTASNTVYTDYQTTGGAGSGGGAGLGGVFFVDKGARLTLNNVSFSGNTATGGAGGGAGISLVSPFQATVNAASADASTDKILLPNFAYGTLSDSDPRSQQSGGPDARNALTVDSFTLKTADPLLVKGATAYLGNIATSADQQAKEGASTPAPSATITDVISNSDGTVTYKIGQTYTTANGTTQTGAYVVPADSLSTFKLNDPSSGFYGEDNTSGSARASGNIFIPPSQILPGTGLCARQDAGAEVCGTINDIKYGSGSNIVGFTLAAPSNTAYPQTVSAPLFNSVEVPRFQVTDQSTNTINTIGPGIPFQIGMLVYGDGIPAGTTITGVTTDPTSQQVTAITLSNNVDPADIRSFKAAFSPLLNNDTANNKATIQLASVTNLGVGEMVSGSGIATGAVITAIDQTNNTITINSAVGAAGLTAIGNGGFQVTANPVINARQVTATGMTYAVLGSAAGLQVGNVLQGTGIPDYAKITAIDGNQVYYVIDPTLANLVKGGSLNGLSPTDLTVAANGKAGNFGSPLNSVLGDGEGTNGTNGYNGKASTTTAGGNGGAGGGGSFGSPVNTQLIFANTLDALTIGADIAGIIDDAANPFTIPKAISDGIGLGVDVLAQVNDLIQLSAYTVQLGLGEAGLGGGGGSGGAGGNGGDYFGGGAGGVGGRGGNGALPITDGGAGGAGGTGGKGGFGAGGGSGGQGGLGGAGGRSDNGSDGNGGQGGFGGGVGSSGYAGSGGGGSGYGGAIFVRSGGTLTITGNALFENNSVLAGSSNDGGSAGQAAGGDLFMMKGSTVTLQPGVGNTITFTDGIADDSAASLQNASYAAGQGAGLTITGGGLVQFQAANTYTGTTTIQGATLEADQGVGLNVNSRLYFNGSGTIGTAGSISEQNAGVLLTSGKFTRSVGTGPTNVAWNGSGGFAATADGLTVNLGQINGGQGPTLNWGVGAFKPSTLVFGSSAPDATGAVTFMNAINLGGNVGRIAVYDNAGATTDRAILTGAITGGSLIVNDANYAGSLYLDGQNALTGIVVQNGLVSTLDGTTVGRLMAPTGGSVIVAGGTLLLGGAETLTTVMVGQPGTLDARGAITSGNILNAGTILFGSTAATGTIDNFGTLTAAQTVATGTVNNYTTGVMSFANGIRTAGTITNAGQFALGGGQSTATNVYNQSAGSTAPVFNQFGALTVTGNVLNAGTWGLGADLSAGGTVENDGTTTVFGAVANGAETAATRTIKATTFTGAATGQINLGGTGATPNTLQISQTGTSSYLGTVTGAGNLVVLGGGSLTLGGVLSQIGGLRVQGGTVTLSAADTFKGQTLIDPNARLLLTGGGSVSGSSGVAANGLFDVSGVTGGNAAIRSLSGTGAVQLGGVGLTLTNAADEFDGVVSGTGSVTVAGGTQTLGGVNSYAGLTTVSQGAQLNLTGAGSIAASSGLVDNGIFSIGATNNGATIASLSGAGTGSMMLGTRTLLIAGPGTGDFAGVISGSGNLVVAGGGQMLDGVNSYTGRTIINANAGLALMGSGSVAASSGVTDNGVFVIQGTKAGASIASLSGSGAVGLGAQTLTLTNASDTFAGTMAGSGGLAVTGGVEKLSGRNQYTGQTLIGVGATLGLVGTGNIGASSGVTANGTFAINETTGGAVITSLSGAGTGSVALGNQTLAIATGGGDFAGVIGGAGNLTISGGTQVLRGTNSYTGRTTVGAGAALSLVGNGSVAASSGVTDNGLFSIAGTTAGSSVASLSGAGTVQLGGNTLTLTNASETFAGTIGGTGGLVVAGGTEKLSGQNGYTGTTAINNGAALALVGTGTIGSSAGVIDNGSFAIGETTNGATIRSLSGSGQVQLGAQRLALTAAVGPFGGTISGTGGLDLVGGSETLTGTNSYTGTTTIAATATLALAGTGSIATSAGVLDNGTFDITGATTSAAIRTLAGNGLVVLGGNRLTLTQALSRFDGVISGTQGLSLAGGTEVLGGVNGYAGRTLVAGGATLALAGNGSIASSGGVDVFGTFDISNTATGASIASLSGTGNVQLGGAGLTLLNAADEFDGVIGGTGSVTMAGGTQTLGGVDTYTGLTTVASGAQLNLTGSGSIAASSGLLDNGVFSIGATTNGASVQTLSGTGQLVLGAQQLTVTSGNSVFSGTVVGTGGLVINGGVQALSGVSGYTGRTIINPNTALFLVGTSSIAASSGVTDNGLFSITNAAGGESIVSLSGAGAVALGTNTLTLTNAADQFAGVIGGSGGLTLAGGSEGLSGTNAYTGRTTIGAGATLSLVGTGSIATSSGVTDNGVFSIAGTNASASIASLSGNGGVVLGGRTLTLTAAGGDFAGIIGGSGSLTVAGGQVLRGANTFTGRTVVNAGGTLSLVGGGSVATSSGVTANGMFVIAGANGGESVSSLAGTGSVQLGGNTLTLTNASETFAGSIGGIGGLSVAGGTEKLSGQNGYTGQTLINTGATLGLAGTGTIAASSSVIDNGVFAIKETTNGATIRSLSGAGQVQLGTQRLALSAAADRFDGTVVGAGGLDVVAGSETLTGTNSYTAASTVAAYATLALAGTGSISTSAGVLDNGTFDITGTSAGAAITTLAGSGAVLLGTNRLTLTSASSQFNGVISGAQGITLAGGQEVLGGVSSYAGRTQVAGGATLALAGNGSIAASGGVDLAGTFDISNAASGASITSLSGTGAVQLGGVGLTLTNAADEFDGVVNGAGTVTVAGGTETLGGVNSYAGLTTVSQGAQLNLTGAGSIAASSGLVDNGIFSIGATTNGATLQGLSGTGQVVLGGQQLTVTGGNGTFAGTFVGTGGVAFSGGGTQTLSGVSGFTGRTVINPNTALYLVGGGSIAASSGVTDNGLFSIGGASGGVSITSLSGVGSIALGANTLTLTNASETFAGIIGGSGGLTLAGGSEGLSGANVYTGRTTIAAGTTLSLTGDGTIAASRGVTDNGVFSIAGVNAGASIASLSGTGAVALGANTLTLTAAADWFDGTIAGTGGLSVTGGAEMLTAAQAYTGTTTIAAGAALVLSGQGSVAGSARVLANGLLDMSGAATAALTSLAGTGQVAIGANVLTLTNAADRFDGVVTGTGGLTVARGSETLAGTNLFSGRTTVASGATLALAGTGSVATSGGVSIAGTLDLTGTTADVALNQLDGAGTVVLGGNRLVIGAASGTFAGTVSGAGALAILGGQMSLTGTNTYAGGTQVSNAALTIASDGSLGTSAGGLALQNASLTFGGATTSTRVTTLTGGNTLNTSGNTVALNGTIGGSGGFAVTGGNVLTLGGTNSYAGGTMVTGGTTLRIGSDAALGAASSVLMLQNGTLQATGNLTSTRDVLIAGSDRIDGNGYQISLNGTMYGQSGGDYVAIASGGMRLTGILAIDSTGFTVTQGAVLRGTGTFNRAVTVAGTLAPGNSPGTMAFNAPVAIAPTGTLSIDIDGIGTGTGAGNYSRLVLTGTNAFTAGGTLAPVLRGITGSATNSFVPSLGQTFTVVQTNVAVNGTFNAITQPNAGLATGTRLDAFYGNNVTLIVTPADYGNLAALFAGGATLTPDQAAVGAGLNALRGAPGTKTDPQTSSILAAIYSLRTAADIASLETQLAGGVYTDTLRAAAARSNGFGHLVDGQADAGTRGGGQLWFTGSARSSDLGTSTDRPTGFAGGAGLRVGENGVVGIAGGYDAGRLTYKASGGRSELKSTHLTAYAAWTGPNLFVRAQAGATRTDLDVTRAIPQLNLTARGQGSGWGFAGGAEVGYVAKVSNWLLQPSLSARVAQIRVGDILENGAGPVSLNVNRSGFTEVQGLANLRIGRNVQLAGDAVLRPVLDIGYLRELHDRAGSVTTQFIGAPGTSMTFESVADGRDALRLGAGASLASRNGFSISVQGSLDTQKNVENRSISAGLGWRW